MEITSARTGGTTATAIDVLDAKIADLTTALANSAVISSGHLTVTDPVLGIQERAILGLTTAESATLFTTMKTMLQARRDALGTALTGLT